MKKYLFNRYKVINLALLIITITAYVFLERNMSEDFLLMDCTDWGDEKVAHYLEANKVLGFLESGAQWIEKHATRFVPRS